MVRHLTLGILLLAAPVPARAQQPVAVVATYREPAVIESSDQGGRLDGDLAATLGTLCDIVTSSQ